MYWGRKYLVLPMSLGCKSIRRRYWDTESGLLLAIVASRAESMLLDHASFCVTLKFRKLGFTISLALTSQIFVTVYSNM